MARLVVLRGQTPFRDLELTQVPVGIGRGQQNDVVLEDPLNSVSRNHAEIRFEKGRYLLVDRNSENGIWVAGRRELAVTLDPGVVASIGPFRLMVEGAPPILAAGTAGVPEVGALASAPVIPAAEAKTTPMPVLKGAPAKTATPAPKVPLSPQARRQRTAAAVVVALLVVSTVGWLLLRSPGNERSSEIVQLVSRARTQIQQGECARALVESIEPALAIDPADAETLSLELQAQGCVAAPPPPPQPFPPAPPPTDPAVIIAEHLSAATQLIEGRNCAEALTDHINVVLQTDPANATALELQKRASACGRASGPGRTTPMPPPTPPVAFVTVPAGKGGLVPLSGETEAQYQQRMRDRQAEYDRAVRQVQSREYATAISSLQALQKLVPPGYLDLDNQLAAARTGLRNSAQAARSRGADFEKAENWDAALTEYRRAQAADPALGVEADIKRVSDLKLKAGEDACERGRRAYAVGNVDGYRAAYQQVLALLPQSHACYELASTRTGSR